MWRLDHPTSGEVLFFSTAGRLVHSASEEMALTGAFPWAMIFQTLI